MQRYIDAESLLSEARMMWTDYHEIFILVEGVSDKKFFSSLLRLPPKVQFRPVFGWENVYDVIKAAKDGSFSAIAGIIDADYHDLIQDSIFENQQLFFTDETDIEMMLFFSSAYEKFLQICADEAKLSAQPDLRQPILGAAICLGALRAVSAEEKYYLDFDGFECKEYIDRDSLSPNQDKLIKKVVQRTRSKGTHVEATNEEIKVKISNFIRSYDGKLLCNGHDVLEIAGIAMRKFYASVPTNQYTPESLFNYLLMGYSFDEFSKTQLCQKITQWIHSKLSMDNE